MTKLFKWLMALFIPFLSLNFNSCTSDEPDNSSSTTTAPSKEVSPQVKIITSASTKDDFTVAFRVKSVEKPSVTFYWSKHASKPANPSLDKHSYVTKTYDEVQQSGYTWWYYKVTHAGFSPGNYVYYRVSAENSKGIVDSPVGYVIIKR